MQPALKLPVMETRQMKLVLSIYDIIWAIVLLWLILFFKTVLETQFNLISPVQWSRNSMIVKMCLTKMSLEIFKDMMIKCLWYHHWEFAVRLSALFIVLMGWNQSWGEESMPQKSIMNTPSWMFLSKTWINWKLVYSKL